MSRMGARMGARTADQKVVLPEGLEAQMAVLLEDLEAQKVARMADLLEG